MDIHQSGSPPSGAGPAKSVTGPASLDPRFPAPAPTRALDEKVVIIPRASPGHSVATLLPIMAVVFIAYLVIGLAMPVLPLYVHQDRGLR